METRRFLLLFVVLGVLVAMVRPAFAGKGVGRTSARTADDGEDFLEEIRRDREDLQSEHQTLLDTAIQQRLNADIAKSKEVVWNAERSRRVLEWDETSSMVSFVLAHVVVVGGFLLGVLEFVHASRLRKRGRVVDDTEITIKMESIAVRTTSFGLLLLVASIIFYFLYLKFVYTIQIVSL
ncbi:MAG: hypothetical protein FJ109_12085 [Deltaproteobacteria bacterium]|nr:hypothetical protein [Deltaproteobacteria bacterium]